MNHTDDGILPFLRWLRPRSRRLWTVALMGFGIASSAGAAQSSTSAPSARSRPGEVELWRPVAREALGAPVTFRRIRAGKSRTLLWEEMDLRAAAPPNTDDGSRPIFRSFLPSASASRTFPQLSDILSNTTTLGESLPTTTRAIKFRVTARDNRPGGGGTASDDMVLNVRADRGPFVITQPNTAVIWPGESVQTVTWNVANTAAAPVSSATVKISLSTDGGLTFPTVLVASTPNDGSEVVTVPNVPTTLARIKVEAVGNVFFDVSNATLTIITCGSGVQRGGQRVLLRQSPTPTSRSTPPDLPSPLTKSR